MERPVGANEVDRSDELARALGAPEREKTSVREADREAQALESESAPRGSIDGEVDLGCVTQRGGS